MTLERLDEASLDLVFRHARTHRVWLPKPVTDAELRAAFDLAMLGPTSFNTCPGRIVFVRTPEGKERLKPALNKSNVDKTMSAPATAIFAHDLRFFDKLDKLVPVAPDAKKGYDNKTEPEITAEATLNGTLFAAYFILAARSLGLDCGPMIGFDAKLVDATFFAGTTWRASFLCNLGHGDPAALRPRWPRLDFEEAGRLE